MGYYPPSPNFQRLYDERYFEEYERRANTPMGAALTKARLDLVRAHFPGWRGRLIDIGVGSGQFVRAAGCKGYDINPRAEHWLKYSQRWRDPYKPPGPVAISCWDSLEHIADPDRLVSQVGRWVFVSLPIFKDAEHVLSSKHFKPDEHIWYWTEKGFKNWLDRLGFDCLYHSEIETELGREDIHTFVFRRKKGVPGRAGVEAFRRE
jgi:hypothetical protein